MILGWWNMRWILHIVCVPLILIFQLSYHSLSRGAAWFYWRLQNQIWNISQSWVAVTLGRTSFNFPAAPGFEYPAFWMGACKLKPWGIRDVSAKYPLFQWLRAWQDIQNRNLTANFRTLQDLEARWAHQKDSFVLPTSPCQSGTSYADIRVHFAGPQSWAPANSQTFLLNLSADKSRLIILNQI